MGKGRSTNTKPDPVTCKDTFRPSPSRMNTRFWPSGSGATTPRTHSPGEIHPSRGMGKPGLSFGFDFANRRHPEEYKTSKLPPDEDGPWRNGLRPRTRNRKLWSTEFGNIISVGELCAAPATLASKATCQPTPSFLIGWPFVSWNQIGTSRPCTSSS